MAAWPAYARMVLSGASDGMEASVARTEMERGVPKQRIINTNVMAQLGVTVVFQSRADVASFDTWYLTTIGRIAWFDLTHPRTASVIQARLVGGAVGPLQPAVGGFGVATRDVVLEYLR